MSGLTMEQAEALATRTLAAIGECAIPAGQTTSRCLSCADRERLASDLEGLRECYITFRTGGPVLIPDLHDHARRYTDGLLRTAALYGVEP